MNNMQDKYNKTLLLIKARLMRKRIKARLERAFCKSMRTTMNQTSLGDFYKDRLLISEYVIS